MTITETIRIAVETARNTEPLSVLDHHDDAESVAECCAHEQHVPENMRELFVHHFVATYDAGQPECPYGRTHWNGQLCSACTDS